MVSEFNVAYKDWEAFNSGYAFSIRAHLDDVHFVFTAHGDWAVSFAALVLGISGTSFLRTN